MGRSEEVRAKHEREASWLGLSGRDAVLIVRPSSVAWTTAGAGRFVSLSASQERLSRDGDRARDVAGLPV